jgi:hypothetical protein
MSPQQPMNDSAVRERLAILQALTQQMSAAISAIEHNDLRHLQSSVAAQESLCCELNGKPWPISSRSTESELVSEVRAAKKELAQLNRIYARVLRNAQRSAALMTTLYRSFGQDAPSQPEQSLSVEA